MIGLYLHIPFCAAICNYCNFNRGLFDESTEQQYVAALEREILETASVDIRQADTIFFGGGTPSLLEPLEVERLLLACRTAFDVANDAEITLEANPDSITPVRLAGWRAAGINRLSIGVQSFQDDELRRLSRLHTVKQAELAIGLARTSGFDNVSIDLMMWLPEQRVTDWMYSVETAIAVGPDHISAYLLELYPNAPLREEMARCRWSLAPDEDAATMYETSVERFAVAGYQQYEISNFARVGRQARHNLKYWTDGEWFGFGCGAHSTVDGVRRRNVSSTADYIDRIRQGVNVTADQRSLSPLERCQEAMFTGLRLTQGVDLACMQERYGVDVWRDYGERLESFVDAGLLEVVPIESPRQIRLTARGMLLANEVMAVFV